ncbi:MAG: hypothetical protein [Bacteriophage sp.]|nr:MAG: hypothetical protein [Bacteriophage sp.]
MNTDIKIELEFYFVWDDMIVLKTKSYQDVLILAIEYFNKYGENHNYNLYIVNKHDLKDFIKIKE